MANVINLNAESGANYIADDSSAGITFENTGSGSAIKVTSGGGGAAIDVVGSSAANASITGIKLANLSVASGAVLMLSDTAFVSMTTIKATTGGVAGTGGIRVVRTDGSLGWIPVYPDGAVTAAAVA